MSCCSVLKRWGLKKVSVAFRKHRRDGCHPDEVLDEYFLRNFSKFHCFLCISSYFFGLRRMNTVWAAIIIIMSERELNFAKHATCLLKNFYKC
jgi:hypothetical protein